MKCVICGKEIEKTKYFNPELCSNECFKIWYWDKQLDDKAIIIDGICYHDGGRKRKSYDGYLGFGGCEFKIRMNDGRMIETNNLWHNGIVPKERNIKDNAQFIIKVRVQANDLPF